MDEELQAKVAVGIGAASSFQRHHKRTGQKTEKCKLLSEMKAISDQYEPIKI